MKNKVLFLFILSLSSCFEKAKEIEQSSIVQALEVEQQLCLDSFTKDWINLTSKNKEKIILNQCGIGNTIISIYKYNDSFYLLRHGSQEDDLYFISKAYKKTDTSIFDVYYIGDNYSNIFPIEEDKKRQVKFIQSKTVKWESNWLFDVLENNMSLFTEEKYKLKYKKEVEDCKECLDEEICEESRKYQLKLERETNFQEIRRLLKHYKERNEPKYNFVDSRRICTLLKEIQSIVTIDDFKIMKNTFEEYDQKDKVLKLEIIKTFERARIKNKEVEKVISEFLTRYSR